MVTLVGNDARIGKGKTVMGKYMKTIDVADRRNGPRNRNRFTLCAIRFTLYGLVTGIGNRTIVIVNNIQIGFINAYFVSRISCVGAAPRGRPIPGTELA